MARLRRADCSGPGFRRARRGRGFSYLDEDGDPIEETEVVARLRSLGIPPAWKDVWICPWANGHIQATGVDAAGRKQYLYHQEWRTRRDAEKFDEMLDFAKDLPALRKRVATRPRDGRRAHARAGPRLRRAPARPRVLPDRDRGVRGRQRELRAGDDAQGPREARGRGHDGLRLPGEVRRAPDPRDRRPGRRSTSSGCSSAGAAAARSCWPTSRAAAGATSARATSTSTSRRSPAATTPPRTSGPGTRPSSRPSPSPWPAGSPARKTGRKRAITRAVKEVAHYLGNTPAVCRASYIDPRVFDAYEGGLTVAPALEKAAEAGGGRDGDPPAPARACRRRPDRRARDGAGRREDRRVAFAPARAVSRRIRLLRGGELDRDRQL